MNHDPLRNNKIAGAVLAALLLGLIGTFIGDLLFPHGGHASTPPPLTLVDVEAPTSEGDKKPAPIESIDKLLAGADISKGKSIAHKCSACHTFSSKEVNRIGPHLWKVYGRSVASVSGFKYSAAMKAHGGTWTEETLNKFLYKPRAYVPKTKMNFAGLRKAQDRADVIAWLKTLK